jgi:hypothetical protein
MGQIGPITLRPSLYEKQRPETNSANILQSFCKQSPGIPNLSNTIRIIIIKSATYIFNKIGKVHESPAGEYRYRSTPSLTAALDGVGGQRHAPAPLPPGKTRYPLYWRLGGPRGRSGEVRKISPTPGFDPQTVQPVASRYTD